MTASEDAMRAEAMQRIAISLDLPPELLAGSPIPKLNRRETARANQQQRAEERAGDFLEEMSEAWLRPILREHGIENADQYTLGWEEQQ